MRGSKSGRFLVAINLKHVSGAVYPSEQMMKFLLSAIEDLCEVYMDESTYEITEVEAWKM